MDQIKNVIKQKLENNNFYDLEIYLNGKIFRLSKAKKNEDIHSILLYLYENLLETNLENYQNFVIKLFDYYINSISLIENFTINEDELSLLFKISSKVKICKEILIFFDKINKNYFKEKNIKIFNFLLNESIKYKEFGLGQKVLLRLEFNMINKILYKKFFNEWIKNIPENEIDLIISRYIFYLIIKKDINSTLRFYESYKEIEQFKNSELYLFCEYLIKCVINKDKDNFLLLLEKFKNNLSRDKNYDTYLNKIKNIYFENSGGLFNMINSVLNIV